MTRRLIIAEDLAEIANGLGEDELEVLLEVARGLRKGKKIYGPLNLERDSRDFQREALDEVRDCLVYTASKLIQIRRGA